MNQKMNFINLPKSKGGRHSIKGRAQLVRTAFYKYDSGHYHLRIAIGEDILRPLKWQNGDKIALSYSQDNHRIWRLQKIDKGGYSLGKTKILGELVVVIRWHLFTPEQDECSIKTVGAKIENDCLIIDASRSAV